MSTVQHRDLAGEDVHPPGPHAAQHGAAGNDAITPAAIGAAETEHTHPDEVHPPGPHAAQHGAEGDDAVTPAAIGAAEEEHTHALVPYTGATENLNLGEHDIIAHRVLPGLTPTFQGGAMIIVNPYVRTGNRYKMEIHAQSSASDGADTPDEVIAAYAAAGYDAIALSDHNLLTVPEHIPDGVIHIPACEDNVASPVAVHLNNLFAVDDRTEADFDSTVNGILSDDALPIINHPHWTGTPLTLTRLRALVRNYVGVEIYNAHVRPNAYATDLWDDLLRGGVKCWGFASDDTHDVSNAAEFNQGWIEVIAPALTLDALKQAILSGSFYASQGPQLTVSMDERLRISASTTEPCTLAFIADGTTVKTVTNVTSAYFDVQTAYRSVRVEVTRVSDSKKAWAQPIFFDQGELVRRQLMLFRTAEQAVVAGADNSQAAVNALRVWGSSVAVGDATPIEHIFFGFKSDGAGDFGAYGGIRSYVADGTLGAPTNVKNGMILVTVAGSGFNGTNFTIAARAFIGAFATGNWSGTSTPTAWNIDTCRPNEVVRRRGIRVDEYQRVGINQEIPEAYHHVTGDESVTNLVQRLGMTPVTGNAPQFDTYMDRVTTTNANQGTAFSLPLTVDATYAVKAKVVGRCTGGTGGTISAGVFYELAALARCYGATKALLTNTISKVIELESASAATWDATIDVNNGNLRVLVTGAENVNVTWDVYIEVFLAV